MRVEPQNIVERCFAILVLIFALIVFSSFVSSITGLMTQLRGMHEDSTKQVWLLRRYLRERGVSKVLSVRIQQFVEHASMESKAHGVPESKVQLLQLLSVQMNNELKCALVMPHMSQHPLFEHMIATSNIMLQRLCQRTLTRLHIAQHDSLFYQGEPSTQMYFVVCGDYRYCTQGPRGEESISRQMSGTSSRHYATVSKEDWISEPTLWASAWLHVGHLQAVASGEVISIDSASFGDVMSSHLGSWTAAAKYAELYVLRLNQRAPEALSDISVGMVERDALELIVLRLALEHSESGHELFTTTRARRASGRSNRSSRTSRMPKISKIVMTLPSIPSVSRSSARVSTLAPASGTRFDNFHSEFTEEGSAFDRHATPE